MQKLTQPPSVIAIHAAALCAASLVYKVGNARHKSASPGAGYKFRVIDIQQRSLRGLLFGEEGSAWAGLAYVTASPAASRRPDRNSSRSSGLRYGRSHATSGA